MTLKEYLTKELLNAEECLEQYSYSNDSKSYWVGQLDALNNALDFLEGAAVYSEAVS
jgi:predicted metal-binding protein